MAEFGEVQGLTPIQAREGIQQSVLARNTCDQPRGYLYVRRFNNLDPLGDPRSAFCVTKGRKLSLEAWLGSDDLRWHGRVEVFTATSEIEPPFVFP